MSSRKIRPPNGPGANGLRGGSNVYSTKTAIGTWMEEYGGPGGYKRGFTTPEFITEAQQQQSGYLKKATNPGFGEPLPFKVNPLDNNPNDEKSKDWKSTSRSEYSAEWPEYWKPTAKISANALKAYRSKWCSDNEAGRSLRFETEGDRAGNAAASAALKVSRIRMMPGTPLSIEKLRTQLVENHGILAICALRSALGGGGVSDEELRVILPKLGCKLASIEFAQIMAHFTSGVTFESSEMVECIALRKGGFDESVVRTVFQSFANESKHIAEVIMQMNPEKNPEVVEGLSTYLDAYTDGDGNISEDAFVMVHADLFAATPLVFNQAFGSLWTAY